MECLISLFQTCGDGFSESEYSDSLANIVVSVRMPLGGLGGAGASPMAETGLEIDDYHYYHFSTGYHSGM